jgi:hypothetical protein
MLAALLWVLTCGILREELAGEWGFMFAASLDSLLSFTCAVFMIGSRDSDATNIVNMAATSVSVGGIVTVWLVKRRYLFFTLFSYGFVVVISDVAAQLVISNINAMDVSPRMTWIAPLIAIFMSIVHVVYTSLMIARTVKICAGDQERYDAVWRQVCANFDNLEHLSRIKKRVRRASEKGGAAFGKKARFDARLSAERPPTSSVSAVLSEAAAGMSRDSHSDSDSENEQSALRNGRIWKLFPCMRSRDDSKRQERHIPQQCNRKRKKDQKVTSSISADRLTPLSSISVEVHGGLGTAGDMDYKNPVTSVDQLYAQAQGIQWFLKQKMRTWEGAVRGVCEENSCGGHGSGSESSALVQGSGYIKDPKRYVVV